VFDHLSTGHAAPKSERLRVGLLLHDPLLALPVHPDCVHATQLIGTILEARGHHVELDFPPAIEQFLHALLSVQPELAGLRQAQVHWIEARIGRRLHAGDLSQALLDEAAASQSVNNTDLTAGQEHLRNIGNAIRHWWDNHDLLVTPTLRQPPWLLGATDQPLEAGLFPHPFSVTGQPVLAVPAHHTAAGLPIGVQLVGRMGSDEELLDLAATLESELNWDRRWPPIATAV
jgi:amidase